MLVLNTLNMNVVIAKAANPTGPGSAIVIDSVSDPAGARSCRAPSAPAERTSVPEDI
jgi:hypothetical protein